MWLIVELIIVAAVVAVDQTTKYAMTKHLSGRPFMQSDFIRGFIDFKYTENSGASWGILQGRVLLLTIFTAILLVGLLVFLVIRAKKDPKILRVSLLLIFSGGASNLFDRIMFGYVRDFVRFTFIDFPVFNLADSAITIGGILLLVYVVIEFVLEGKKAKELKEKEKCADSTTELQCEKENIKDLKENKEKDKSVGANSEKIVDNTAKTKRQVKVK